MKKKGWDPSSCRLDSDGPLSNLLAFRVFGLIMENQMEKKKENEMETRVI